MVGREAELARLLTLLDDDGPLLAVVHGVAGSGKSTLVRALASEAARRGATVLTLDGRDVRPTPQGVLAALGRAAGAPPAGALAALGDHSGPVVVVLDTAERLRLVDDWLRRDLLPALPENARVVLATRDAPGAAWRGAFGALMLAVPAAPLEPDAAWEVLHRAGLDDAQAAWVNRFARGHPLSLQLGASAIRERPGAAAGAVPPTVLQGLAALYLDGLEPATRRALDAAS